MLVPMQSFRRLAILAMLVPAGILSVHVAAACSCPPSPPPPPGGQQIRIPSLNHNDVAVFVAAVEEVFPKDVTEYESRWKDFDDEKVLRMPPSVEHVRSFILKLWPTLFSAAERDRISKAKTLDEVQDAVGKF